MSLIAQVKDVIETPLSVEPRKQPGRLLFLDGLRAIAALGVIVCHLYDDETSPLNPILKNLPHFFRWLMMQGNWGVEIFFVLSGFVISRSVSKDWVNFKFLGRFALRRSLRLDPPYWAVLTVVLAMKVLMVHHNPHEAWFKGRGFDRVDMIANYFYLQTIFQRKIVLGVSWTLVCEIMFYLTYVILLGVSQRGSALIYGAKRPDPVRPAGWVLAVVFGSTFVLSLWLWYFKQVGQWGHNGWYFYIGRWYMFFTGALLQWVVSKWANKWTLFVFLGLMVALSVWSYWPFGEIEHCGIATVLTAGIIYAANALNKWDRWLSGRAMQQIGKISYSVYLVHLPVCTVVSATTIHFLGLRAISAIVAIPICFAMSIGVAQLCYWLLESPSLALSQKIKVHHRAA